MKIATANKLCRLYVLSWALLAALVIIWQIQEQCFHMICSGIDGAINLRDYDVPWEITREKLSFIPSFRGVLRGSLFLGVLGLPVFYAWLARPFEEGGFFRKHPKLAGYGALVGSALLLTMGILIAVEAYQPFEKPVVTSEGHFKKNTVKDASFLFRLTGETVNGEKFEFSQLRGKTVLLDFWASWCQPCRESFPELKTLGQRYEKRTDFALVTVSLDEERETALATLRKYQIPGVRLFGSGWDEKSPLVSGFEVTGIPCPVIITKEGKWYKVNPSSPSALGQYVREILRPPPQP